MSQSVSTRSLTISNSGQLVVGSLRAIAFPGNEEDARSEFAPFLSVPGDRFKVYGVNVEDGFTDCLLRRGGKGLIRIRKHDYGRSTSPRFPQGGFTPPPEKSNYMGKEVNHHDHNRGTERRGH